MRFLGCGRIDTLIVAPDKRLVRETVSDANSEIVKLKWVKRE